MSDPSRPPLDYARPLPGVRFWPLLVTAAAVALLVFVMGMIGRIIAHSKANPPANLRTPPATRPALPPGR